MGILIRWVIRFLILRIFFVAWCLSSGVSILSVVGGDKRVHAFRLRGSLFREVSASKCVRQATPFCAGYRRVVEVVT